MNSPTEQKIIRTQKIFNDAADSYPGKARAYGNASFHTAEMMLVLMRGIYQSSGILSATTPVNSIRTVELLI